MKIKCIKSIPKNYSTPKNSLFGEVTYGGQKYTVLGCSKKRFSFLHRMKVGIRVFLKTIFTLGIWLCSEKTRDDWKAFWNGKRVVMLYTDSENLIENVKKANRYKKEAKNDDARAQCHLGVMYAEGRGVEQNDKKAAEYFRQAAKKGSARAQYHLGIMYAKGQGVEQNVKKALKYLDRAAFKGCTPALDALGVMYAEGLGLVKQDDTIALSYFHAAAKKGHAPAQYHLGLMYAEGRVRGIEQSESKRKAVEYYTKAADKGYTPALEALKVIRTEEEVVGE